MRSAEAIDYIKSHVNIVDIVRRYVDLKPNGGRFVAPCPFHQETKPSFSVSAEKGFFYCFGCHASGDIFEFYSKINGLDFKETLEELGAVAGITIETDKLATASINRGETEKKNSQKKLMLLMHETAARHFMKCLAAEEGLDCRNYIKQRGLSVEIQERFELGWAPSGWRSLTDVFKKRGYDLDVACEAGLLSKSDTGSYYDRFRGRLMFPIKNLAGQTIAFGGRIIDNSDNAKYINSTDTPIYRKKENLYGLFQARRGITAKKSFILTEGYMDVLALWQFGFDYGVGVLGTALTEEQIRRLSGFAANAILIFDGDRAGRKAALRSCEMLLARGLSCKVVLLPPEDDIDSLLRSKGPEELQSLVDSAKDGLSFCIEVLRDGPPAEMVEWARSFLASIQIPELVSPYATLLATRLGISEDALRQHAALNIRGKKCPAPEADNSGYDLRDAQILAFVVRYPERLEDLRQIGANLALNSDSARLFWNLVEQWGEKEVFYHLDEKQKEFWLAQRGPKAPPLTNGDFELNCLGKALEAYYAKVQGKSLTEALAESIGGENFDAELEYLRALQETLEKKK